MAERATDGAAKRDLHVAPEQNGRHQTPSETRRRIDLGLEQRDQHGGALRVADEDDRPAMVVVRQVVLPRGEQAVVRDGPRRLRRMRQTGDRHLAVHGCPHSAPLGEARRLDEGGRPLGGLHREVGVDAWLPRDGRVHVKAIEAARRGRGRGEGRLRHPSPVHGRGRPTGAARIRRSVGVAQPDRARRGAEWERGRSRWGHSRRRRAPARTTPARHPARHACVTRRLTNPNHRRGSFGRTGPERRAEEHGASA